MVEAWFAIFSFILTAYMVLDGRNLGAAALRTIVAKDAAERRQVLDAIGPLWTWHEVWLVAAGGVLLMAFPSVLANAFAGYYLALFLVLWLLVLRGMAMEVGRHVADPLWQTFWDVVLTGASAGLALLLGVALGNMVRGVPLDSTGEFHLPFFTDFGVRGAVGLLDWYTLSFGAMWLALLCAHGATFLAFRTAGPVRDRSRIAARRLWLVALALGVVVAVETRIVRPDLWPEFVARPLAAAFLVVAAAGAVAIRSGLRGRGLDGRAYAGSCAVIAGVMASRAVATFPILLHSTVNPDHSVTAYAAAAGRESLSAALWWWPVAAVLSVLWGVLVARVLRARARPNRAGRSRRGGRAG